MALAKSPLTDKVGRGSTYVTFWVHFHTFYINMMKIFISLINHLPQQRNIARSELTKL